MEVNIRIAGAAGQGIQTAGDLLGRALARSGLFAFCWKDNESRIRGGLNYSHLRCGDAPAAGVVERIDILVGLSERALDAYGPLVAGGGLVIREEAWSHPAAAPFTLGDLSREAGSDKVQGTVAMAACAAVLGLDPRTVLSLVGERFRGALEAVNLRAAQVGLRAGSGLRSPHRFPRIPGGSAGRLWIGGAEAAALGAVAGGLTFMAGYPMSPATGIMTALAGWARKAGLVVEQAEDEIAAVNMVAGASYAGARAMTATSGGGFDLMAEGVSLLGMIEAPAVFVIGQRPGPATGLPTRTAQGDLDMVRHAGHGSFARILLAPRDIPGCFHDTARAFDLAERFQVPVFVLADQLLLDAQAVVDPFDVSGLPRGRHFLSRERLEAMPDYRRYEPAASGISPMAAPGASRHVVAVDSDEHDPAGHIVEAASDARAMASKRARKAQAVEAAAEMPEVSDAAGDAVSDAAGDAVSDAAGDAVSDAAGKELVVSWGSTYDTLAEALDRLRALGRDCGHVHFRWMHPLPEERIRAMLSGARRLTVVDCSAGADLARLVREMALRKPDRVVNKLDGRPFSVEELVGRLSEEVDG